MLLFVGLGNPGDRYADNRHNIGFMAVDELVHRHSFSPYRARFSGVISEGRLGDEKVLALKPLTFMNESGRAVGEAMRFYKIDPCDLVVFHDELDLAPGKIKVKQGGGHAGHNGLRSIMAHVGADFVRVRMGIGHPGHKDRVSPYVLSDFAKADWPWVDAVCEAMADEAPWLVRKDWPRFMSDVARRLASAD
jgi:PTH1 family peptidyl-tRNA hydrolase